MKLYVKLRVWILFSNRKFLKVLGKERLIWDKNARNLSKLNRR